MRKAIHSVRDWQIYLAIVVVGTIVYGKSVTYKFTYADDTQLVVINQELLSNFANIPKLFETDVFISTTSSQVFYRPLLNILLMIETHIGKDSPVVYHCTNILLHLACSILVFVVLQQLGSTKPIAGIAALLFCVHPLNASAVVWIPGQNDTLLTLLLLGSFSFLLRALDTGRIGPLIGHFILFFLALLTKEPAIVLPILSVSYVIFFRRTTLPRSVWIIALSSYFVLIVVWYGLRSLVPQTFTVHLTSDFLIARYLSNLPALLLYFGKIFFPFNLSIFPNLMDNSIWTGVLGIALFLAVYLIRRPSSAKGILWGFGWFLLFLIPSLVSGIIFHEHRAYCPFLGLLFAVTQLPLVQSVDLSKNIHVLGFVSVLAVFAVVAMLHSEKFRNRTAYATSAFTSDPSIDNSYACLAGLFIDEGNYDDAERVVRKGLARIPNMKTAHRMLGDILAHRGEYGMAAQEYETYLRLDPLQLYTYIVYGKMCMDAGRIDDAPRLWKTSVRINPNFILGYYYLANFYLRVKNDPDSAMIYARQIQQRGVSVMPELLRAIQENPLYGRRTP
jgi:Tfp pilus assembly protein PilF